MRLLIENNKKFLRTHTQLLKRLHGIQSSELPVVTDFCRGSGLDQIQWWGLHESYLKQMDWLLTCAEEMMQPWGFQDFITVRFVVLLVIVPVKLSVIRLAEHPTRRIRQDSKTIFVNHSSISIVLYFCYAISWMPLHPMTSRATLFLTS